MPLARHERTCNVAAGPLQEARQPGLVQEVAGVVAGGAVHAEADIDAVIQSKPHLSRHRACVKGSALASAQASPESVRQCLFGHSHEYLEKLRTTQSSSIGVPALTPHRRDAGPEADVGGRAVRDAEAVVRELFPLRLVQHAAVREPAVVLVPTHPPADGTRVCGDLH